VDWNASKKMWIEIMGSSSRFLISHMVITNEGIKVKRKFLKVRGLYTCQSNTKYTIQCLGYINSHNKIDAKPGSEWRSFNFNSIHIIHQMDSHATSQYFTWKMTHIICASYLYLAGQSRRWIKWMNQINKSHIIL
jgi:hypothetical protein